MHRLQRLICRDGFRTCFGNIPESRDLNSGQNSDTATVSEVFPVTEMSVKRYSALSQLMQSRNLHSLLPDMCDYTIIHQLRSAKFTDFLEGYQILKSVHSLCTSTLLVICMIFLGLYAFYVCYCVLLLSILLLMVI